MTHGAPSVGALPAQCAGLRQDLLHHWQQGFPLRDSPFQVLGRELGATLREVMGHCHQLAGSGALDAIRVQWGPGLQRVRWRCGFVRDEAPDAELVAALRRLPGVTGWDWIEPDRSARSAADWPTLWFDIVARDAAAAVAQRDAFESRCGPLLCMPLSEAAPGCRCDERHGPCADVALARQCEAGLPLVAHPYRRLAEAVQRSEREVLGALRRWQRDGALGSVGLGGPTPETECLWTVAALSGPAVDEATHEALLARPGVAEVEALPAHAQWPYGLQVRTAGIAAPAAALLERALASCGLDRRPRRMMRVHRVRLRAAPLLFAGPGAGPVADA